MLLLLASFPAAAAGQSARPGEASSRVYPATTAPAFDEPPAAARKVFAQFQKAGAYAADTPAAPEAVLKAAASAKAALYCSRCRGTGKVVGAKMGYRTVRERVMIPSGKYTRKSGYREVTQWGPIRSLVPCTECGGVHETYRDGSRTYTRSGPDGSGVTRDVPALHGRLGELARLLLALERKSAPAVWQRGCNVLEEAAFDHADYAAKCTVLFQTAAASPGVHPAVFVGEVADVRYAPKASFFLVRLYRARQYAAVVCKRRTFAFKGQRCLIAGMMTGARAGMPLVTAANISALHEVDPDYRPNVPVPPAKPRPKPKPAAGPGDAAASRLKLARMYAANKLPDKAGGVLREIIREYPDTPQAAEARKMLAKLAPARE